MTVNALIHHNTAGERLERIKVRTQQERNEMIAFINETYHIEDQDEILFPSPYRFHLVDLWVTD